MNRDEAYALLKEFHTPPHVQEHGVQVARIAYFLAVESKKHGIDINPEKLWIAGLIHDFVRVVDFKDLNPELGTREDQEFWRRLREKHGGMHHADTAAEILTERGETDLADIIKRHKYTSIGTTEGPQSWEAKLLYYADKRVAHDQIVNMEDRLEEGRKRHYPDQLIDAAEQKRRNLILALEREIFNKIGGSPEDLKKAIEQI